MTQMEVWNRLVWLEKLNWPESDASSVVAEIEKPLRVIEVRPLDIRSTTEVSERELPPE